MKTFLPNWALVWIVLCLVLMGHAAVADEPVFKDAGMDWTIFDALSDQDKSKFILAALDNRDRALANVRYTVHETSVNVGKNDGQRRFMTKADYEVRRLGDQYWMHLKTHEYFDEDGRIELEATLNWDGKKGKRLVPPEFSRANVPSGLITSTEDDNFSARRLSELLGFRIRLMPNSIPVAQYIREALAGGAKLEATKVVKGATMLMQIAIQDQQWRREIWLDPDRGFMIVRIVNVYGKDYMKGTLEITDAERVAAVWVPKRAVTTGTTYHDKEVTEITHEVKEFQVGGLKQHDVEIDFPAGTKVSDRINNVTYVVGVAGK